MPSRLNHATTISIKRVASQILARQVFSTICIRSYGLSQNRSAAAIARLHEGSITPSLHGGWAQARLVSAKLLGKGRWDLRPECCALSDSSSWPALYSQGAFTPPVTITLLVTFTLLLPDLQSPSPTIYDRTFDGDLTEGAGHAEANHLACLT